MEECCEAKAQELVVLRDEQRRVLIAVLLINLLMFFIEFGAGLFSGSSALLADSLDMLGDSLVYGFSLYVLQRSLAWRASAALAKGLDEPDLFTDKVPVLAKLLPRLVGDVFPLLTARTRRISAGDPSLTGQPRQLHTCSYACRIIAPQQLVKAGRPIPKYERG